MKNPIREIFDFDRRELPVALLLFVFFFMVIAVFQILKPLKNGLFVERYGANLELYAKLANILIAAVGVAAFGTPLQPAATSSAHLRALRFLYRLLRGSDLGAQ